MLAVTQHENNDSDVAGIDALFDPALTQKYNVNGPRYTSYPTALQFSEQIPENILLSGLKHHAGSPLSLYIHIPFCRQLCYYCGCNKIVTRNEEKAAKYLHYLFQEVSLRAPLAKGQVIEQIHLGGGTPTYLTPAQHQALMAHIKAHFSLSEDAEISIEIDPRSVDNDYLTALREMGYNRISLGVQDVNYVVQEAINRVQSTQHIADLVAHARTLQFNSVNLDLVYGLPHQTVESFDNTLAAVVAIKPDRISLFSYAHLPKVFAAQVKIKDAWLPNAEQKSQLMRSAMKRFVRSGYQLIGMDHFALPDDELAIAKRAGKLHRNFQGYTTKGELGMLGLGLTSISAVGNVYAQNPKNLTDYYRRIDTQTPLSVKGIELSKDDEIRREVIAQLMCNFRLSFAAIDQQFGIDSRQYFAEEIDSLQPFINDQLLTVNQDAIEVADHARLVIRNICMTFDQYLDHHQHRYSRVI